MPRLPVAKYKVTPHGGFDAVRKTPADGSCGLHGYPCLHPGLDLAGKPGTWVYAPERGVLVYSHAAGSAPPWRGYGPSVVLLHGDSGWWHLLAHLNPTTLLHDATMSADDVHNAQLAAVAMHPATGMADPITGQPMGSRMDDVQQALIQYGGVHVDETAPLGRMGAANHVHWELRTKSHQQGGTDPRVWLATYGARGAHVPSEADATASGGLELGGMLALIAIAALLEADR